MAGSASWSCGLCRPGGQAEFTVIQPFDGASWPPRCLTVPGLATLCGHRKHRSWRRGRPADVLLEFAIAQLAAASRLMWS